MIFGFALFGYGIFFNICGYDPMSAWKSRLTVTVMRRNVAKQVFRWRPYHDCLSGEKINGKAKSSAA